MTAVRCGAPRASGAEDVETNVHTHGAGTAKVADRAETSGAGCVAEASRP